MSHTCTYMSGDDHNNNNNNNNSNNIGRLTTQETDEMGETSFLCQRLSVITQQFNAVAFAGTSSTSLPLSGDRSDPRCT